MVISLSSPIFTGHCGDAIVFVGLSVFTNILLRSVEVKAACAGPGVTWELRTLAAYVYLSYSKFI